MNFLTKTRVYTPKSLRINLSKYTSYYNSLSTKVAVKEEPQKTELKDFEDIGRITHKILKKKPQKPPFVKNFFLGKFDTDILAYPEILSKEDIETLDQDLNLLRKSINEMSKNLDKFNKQTEYFRKLRLLGLRVPQILGGRELNVTELCKYSEILAESPHYITLMHNNQLSIETIYNKGSDDQKGKYLPDLMNGRITSALCMAEATSSDPRELHTQGVESNGNWIINGQKDWIVNGSDADIMIVFANTEALNRFGLKENKVTAFLVEREFGGITSTPVKTMGLENTPISSVTFNNTIVPAENILGEINEGDKIAHSFLTEFRLLTGPICTSITKNTVDRFTKYCKSDRGSIVLTETELVHYKISKVMVELYAMESMTYLTAGLLDGYENQDCELEAAIVKVFSSERCFKSLIDLMNFFGTPSYMADHWCNTAVRDSLSQVLLNETNDNLKIIISLLGLQYAGQNINEEIKKIRNPLFNPGHAFKRMWKTKRQNDDNPELNLNLKHYLHPSLIRPSQMLEYCILRIQFAAEQMLATNGPEVLNKHMTLLRLADSVIDTYAMAACLSRASRSYCIGLQNSEFELNLASTFCFEAMQRVKKNIKDICDGPYVTNDISYHKIANQAFHCGKYFSEHPTAKVF